MWKNAVRPRSGASLDASKGCKYIVLYRERASAHWSLLTRPTKHAEEYLVSAGHILVALPDASFINSHVQYTYFLQRCPVQRSWSIWQTGDAWAQQLPWRESPAFCDSVHASFSVPACSVHIYAFHPSNCICKYSTTTFQVKKNLCIPCTRTFHQIVFVSTVLFIKCQKKKTSAFIKPPDRWFMFSRKPTSLPLRTPKCGIVGFVPYFHMSSVRSDQQWAIGSE